MTFGTDCKKISDKFKDIDAHQDRQSLSLSAATLTTTDIIDEKTKVKTPDDLGRFF